MYEEQARGQVETDNDGKIVGIDLGSGAFAAAVNMLTAASRNAGRDGRHRDHREVSVKQ